MCLLLSSWNFSPSAQYFCTLSIIFRFSRVLFSRSQQLSHSYCCTTVQLLRPKFQISIWKQMWWTLTGTFELGILLSSSLPELPSLSFWAVHHKDSLWTGRHLLFQRPFFFKLLKPSDIYISLFEICYHGNGKCAQPSTAGWLGSHQRFIHFCRKNNTHVHFLAVAMMHVYLTAINIWISRVIVTLNGTQKRRHRRLCDFMLLSFITAEKKPNL